jgi:amino acid permease
MAKKIYNEEEESRRMMDIVNQKNAAFEAEQADTEKKNAEDRAKTLRKNFWKHLGYMELATLINAGLWLATRFDLMDIVLFLPASYICMFFIGWHLCKCVGFMKKTRR